MLMAAAQPAPALRHAFQRAAIQMARRLERTRIRGLPRLYFTLSRTLFGGGTQVLESASGIKIAADPNDYFSAMMIFGRYAPELLSVLDRVVRPGDSVLDIGAQAGYITSHLARRVGPTGQVHSFEPDPKALALLELTLRANNFNWVRVFPVLAGDQTGVQDFHLSTTLGWSTAVAHTHLADLELVRVPSARIDDLWAAGQIRHPVRLAKIDVEGFECSVLDGMQRLIAEDRPAIICEVNPLMLTANGNSSVELAARVERHRYRVFRLHERSGPFNGGRVDLLPFDPTDATPLYDVLCVPEESAVWE